MGKQVLNTGRRNQKLNTRNLILKTAQNFMNEGLEFNLEDIAKEAKVSRATVYRYFSNIHILVAEAGLDVSTKDPSVIYEEIKGENLEKQVLEIQDYYNNLAIDHEMLFRKYLGTILDSNNSTPRRGARRKKTLELVLADSNYSKEEKQKLSNLFTIFMGIEPLIVTKDVCSLNDKETIDTLAWGMKLLFKGLNNSKDK